MARCRSPSRLTSEMSSTTTTSAASISFAARSERSAPAGSRKANRSGTGVGFAIAGSRPRAPSKCHSATSLPTPSPSAFTCVVRATRRPEVSTAATVWAALARSGGTGTPFSITTRYDEPTRNTKASRETVATSSLDAFLQYGVFATVPEIDREPDHEPDGQPDPGVAGQGQHQAEAAHDAQDRDDVDRDANPPRRADPLHRVRHRRGEVELAVGDHAHQHGRHHHVQQRADRE